MSGFDRWHIPTSVRGGGAEPMPRYTITLDVKDQGTIETVERYFKSESRFFADGLEGFLGVAPGTVEVIQVTEIELTPVTP